MFFENPERAETIKERVMDSIRGRYLTYVALFKERVRDTCPEDLSLNEWYILLGKMFYLAEEHKITDKNKLLEEINSNEEVDDKLFEKAYECFKNYA